MADKDEGEKTIAEDLVVTKYKMAGDIVNRILKQLVDKCVVGASVREICEWGDKQILEETSKVFKKEKELKKGIAFPTCISINNCICHYSPVASEPDYLIKDEDLVKIDLGAHVDGFIAVVAHSLVVGASNERKVTGKKANVMLAAHLASQAALRLLKPGNETYAITEAVQKVAEAYKCKPIEGMLSHQLKQFKIDGEKTIIQNPNDAQRKEHEKFEIGPNEVYAMDVLISTGEGVGREGDARVSIFKRTEETYQLKLKASRMFYAEISNKYGTMPFNLRLLQEEGKARMGVVECLSHKLIDPFQVLYEKPNELVAHFKFTVLLMPNGPHRITGFNFEPEFYQSELSVEDPEIKSLLNQSANPKSAKKKKKKAGKALAGEVGEDSKEETDA
ncbi:proliferation-associated protein 2G4 [Neocloeon triangulifer]|uniref:proliferation-associated protein 2G4 n=1 Tax=Neocloeon triangulifer TaxID=2078957 RepID=UPI00286F7430|nr:proliferation-associated protein 2G4 [Neocloeon triangulifer]